MRTDLADKAIPPEHTIAAPVRWLRFLPRWSLSVALMTLVLVFLLFGGVGQEASDAALGTEYVELRQAARRPGMYRLVWTLDAVIWLMLGGSLIALAGILRRHAPVRTIFILVCGSAQLIGALGGFIRVNGISDIAAVYATGAPVQQTALLESYINLWRIINSHYHIGLLLQGGGFLLAAWGVFSLRGFPRWLAIWLVLPGSLAVAQFVLVTAGIPFVRALNVIGVIGGNIALNSAMTVVLWRPPIQLVSTLADEATKG
jgi:hypothetical protein